MIYSDRANFTFYNFNTTIPLSDGVSSFDVEVLDGGKSIVHTNGGSGFPLPDRIILQPEFSCQDITGGPVMNFTIVVTAAVSPTPPTICEL